MMTGKERMLAAFEEGCPDDIPHALFWTNIDLMRGHFWKNLQGDTPWWMYYTFGTCNDPDFSKRLKVEENILKVFGQDTVFSFGLCPSREWRRHQAVISLDRGDYSVNAMPPRRGEPRQHSARLLEKLPVEGYIYWTTITKDLLNMSEFLKTKEDVEYYVNMIKAEELIEDKRLEWLEALLNRFGDEYFILLGGVTPLTHIDLYHMGTYNLLRLFIKNPKLVHQLLEEVTRKKIEEIKAYGKVLAGREGLGMFNWEWYTGEVLSPEQWKTFSKPYLQRIIKTAQRLGIKYTLQVTGAGMDWEEGMKRVLTMRPDAINLEEEHKGMRTDIAWQADLLKREGHQNDVTLTGNINTTNLLRDGTIAEVEREVKRQIDIGRQYGKFIMMQGCTFDPDTTLERVKDYCRLVRTHGRNQ